MLYQRFRQFLKPKLHEIDKNTKYYTYKVTMKLIELSSKFDGSEVESARWI